MDLHKLLQAVCVSKKEQGPGKWVGPLWVWAGPSLPDSFQILSSSFPSLKQPASLRRLEGPSFKIKD